MRKLYLGLFLVALTTLLLELTLIRVFDAIWYPNMAYMVITLAMFCFALSGIFSSLWPNVGCQNPARYQAGLAVAFGVFALAILPALNLLPFEFDWIYSDPVKGFGYFILMYFVLALPFFMAGLIFINVFTVHAEKIQVLYFWDLLGAGIGCLLLIPFIPRIGPGGLLFLACGLALLASGLFTDKKKWRSIVFVLGILIAAVPFLRSEGYFEFKEHMQKRMVKHFRDAGQIEYSFWDPTSKIDIIDFGKSKAIAYDGGSQSSEIFPFDGDFKALRSRLNHVIGWQFATRGVLVSHYLKRDSGHKVLVIGSAGGQETKAALMYGASHVDAVELVDNVVQLGKGRYASYNGNLYNRDQVNYQTGEGRSFLRASEDRYDVIQIYSNHTSSSIAAGSGAMATTYLQTAEAYQEYFSHLKPGGILHINHHVYPRMITTAALAWRQMGRKDFRRHVIVCEVKAKVQDNLPTVLIKSTPWTAEEVESVKKFMRADVRMVENPVDTQSNFLSEDFYNGEFTSELDDVVPYQIRPATDNRPYFNYLRKSVNKLKADDRKYLNYSTASLLNSQLKRGGIPSDVIHLVVTGIASLLFTLIFIFVPLRFSKIGRQAWPAKTSMLVYFACLGSGFIIVELVMIQLLMKLIGYPLYTYSAVVFALLAAAGLGSYASYIFGIHKGRRWVIAFAGIVIFGLVFLLSQGAITNLFLKSVLEIRMLAAVLMIFPLGFMMGMPFPLGIEKIRKHSSAAIPWAWGMNGLFTVVGGLLSVLLSIYFGFNQAILLSLGIYVLAAWMYHRLSQSQ